MERYLLDTNVLIQMVTERDFTNDVNEILQYSGAALCISSASVQEFIYTLQSEDVIPKKEFGLTVFNVFDFIEDELGWIVKYIDKGHLKQLAQMEIINKHTDPFDRIIIAQAIAEKIPLISSDQRFSKYKKIGLDLVKNY